KSTGNHPPAPALGIYGMDHIHNRPTVLVHGGQQLGPFALHQPTNGGAGKSGADGGGCGQRMQNISHGAQPHNQDFRHCECLSSSVVEWSLGSPTIATRPPQAITMSRSGTFSAV